MRRRDRWRLAGAFVAALAAALGGLWLVERDPSPGFLARLLVEGRERGVGREAALVAALLGERDPFRRAAEPRQSPGDRPAARRADRISRSDLLDRADALDDFARRRPLQTPLAERLDPGGARFVLAARDQLAREVGDGRENARLSETSARTRSWPPSSPPSPTGWRGGGSRGARGR